MEQTLTDLPANEVSEVELDALDTISDELDKIPDELESIASRKFDVSLLSLTVVIVLY
jgi:hypothetical protein